MLKPGKCWANQDGYSPYQSPDPWLPPSCSPRILLTAMLQQLLQNNQTWQLPKPICHLGPGLTSCFTWNKNETWKGKERVFSGWKQNWAYWLPRPFLESILGDSYHQAIGKQCMASWETVWVRSGWPRLWVKQNWFESCVCQLLVGWLWVINFTSPNLIFFICKNGGNITSLTFVRIKWDNNVKFFSSVTWKWWWQRIVMRNNKLVHDKC